MDNSSRAEILTILQHQPNSTVENLALLLHLTRADVRYHLKALLKTGRIVQMPVRHTRESKQAGRPAKTYQLSAGQRPDMLAKLVDALLNQVQSAPNQRESWKEQLARQLVPQQAPESPETQLAQRLNKAIQIINQNPYQARWEARDQGPQIFFYNCPFATIIEKHPELCQVDQLMLQNVTGLSVRQTRKIDLRGPSAPACVFKLALASLHPSEDY